MTDYANDKGLDTVTVVDDKKVAAQFTDEAKEFLHESQNKLMKALEAMNKVLVGQDAVNKLILSSLLADGHVSLVGLPGTGKSLLFNNLGIILGMDTGRKTFTPDLDAADVLGSEILQTLEDGTKAFRPSLGPIFGGELFFADELNRASPRTQSAFLQAMQEKTVTIGNETHMLPMTFSVVATRNPLEQEGTYPLPEAQKDRFITEIKINYAARQYEDQFTKAATSKKMDTALATRKKRMAEGGEAVLKREHGDNDISIDPVFAKGEFLENQQLVAALPIGKDSFDRIGDIVHALRHGTENEMEDLTSDLKYGPGPRARIAFVKAAKAHAFLSGRLTVEKEDIVALSEAVLAHRMQLKQQKKYGGQTVENIIQEAVERTLG